MVTVCLTVEELNALWELVQRAPKTAGEVAAACHLQTRFQAAVAEAEGARAAGHAGGNASRGGQSDADAGEPLW